MFKRASVDGSNEDEFIDIGERLAPYGGADLGPELRERAVAAPVMQPAQPGGVDSSIAPLHLVK